MKSRLTSFRAGLFAAAGMTFIVLTGQVQAAVVQAASSSFIDVSTAVTKAAAGDTVSIPAGKSTWTSTLNVTKPITISGAGATSTVLTGNLLISVILSVDAPLRITGIGFASPTNSGVRVLVRGKTSAGTYATISQLRLDHCRFTAGTRAIHVSGWVEGVIDHNEFYNCNIGIGVSGDDNASWTRAVQPGSIHCVCIEDNTFTLDDTITLAPSQSIYCQEGARVTARHNKVDTTQMTKYDGVFFDSHGNQPGASTVDDACAPVINNGIRGQPLIEMYENVVDVHHTWQHADFRGGTVFSYNNHYSYLSGSVGGTLVLKEEEVAPYGVFTPLRTSTNGGYPANDQINNSHFWGNTMTYAGTTKSITNASLKYPTEEGVFIKAGRDYWMGPPSSTTGSPLGKYYPYNPLKYPHPLAGSTLAPPTDLRLTSGG